MASHTSWSTLTPWNCNDNSSMQKSLTIYPICIISWYSRISLKMFFKYMCAYFCHFHPFPGSLSMYFNHVSFSSQKIYVCHGRNSATTPCHVSPIACRLAGEVDSVDSAHHAAPLAALDLVAGILRSHRDSEQKMNPRARRRVRLSSTIYIIYIYYIEYF